MCIKYKTFFENNYLKIETNILFGDNSSKYISPMEVNGIVIDSDGFETLFINTFENYKEDQLKVFDYIIGNKMYILKNYYLKTIIPIDLVEKEKGTIFPENLFIEILNDDKNKIKKIKLLDKEIIIEGGYDFIGAFEKIYEEIKEKYIVKICGFCKKLSWQPYGGSEFCFSLCFSKFADEYYEINKDNKDEIIKIMDKNNGKYKTIYLSYGCNEYE